jgi:hypothetical protein
VQNPGRFRPSVVEWSAMCLVEFLELCTNTARIVSVWEHISMIFKCVSSKQITSLIYKEEQQMQTQASMHDWYRCAQV